MRIKLTLKSKGKITEHHRLLTIYGRVNYGVDLFPKSFYFAVWIPRWAKGRGYYISISLWLFSFYRGY